MYTPTQQYLNKHSLLYSVNQVLEKNFHLIPVYFN